MSHTGHTGYSSHISPWQPKASVRCPTIPRVRAPQLPPLLARLPMSFATCVANVILQAASFNHIQMRTTTPILRGKMLPLAEITKIKGPNASLDIRQRLDKSQGILVPIDDILLAELRKLLPPGKGYRCSEITSFTNHSYSSYTSENTGGTTSSISCNTYSHRPTTTTHSTHHQKITYFHPQSYVRQLLLWQSINLRWLSQLALVSTISLRILNCLSNILRILSWASNLVESSWMLRRIWRKLGY